MVLLKYQPKRGGELGWGKLLWLNTELKQLWNHKLIANNLIANNLIATQI